MTRKISEQQRVSNNRKKKENDTTTSNRHSIVIYLENHLFHKYIKSYIFSPTVI